MASWTSGDRPKAAAPGRRRRQDPEPGTCRDQPTEPSIWSSIRRLHSTAYSIGRVLVIGSMKPLTIMPIACSSDNPRLIR